MASTFRIACVQTNSVDDMPTNMAAVGTLIGEALRADSKLICLPENAFLMASGTRFHEQVYSESEHPALAMCKELADDAKVWILIGSLALKLEGSEKYTNRSILINDNGEIVARYDKIHLFDVKLPSGEEHRESKRFEFGTKTVVADTPWGKLGMSICYDLRFPYLYRQLAKQGADFLSVPAAFTEFTGNKGHWHTLLRARAMETGCYVFAPAQIGTHPGGGPDGRVTYGHSLIINPWGEILADGGETTGVITADIDVSLVAQVRQTIPALEHDRDVG